MSTSKPIENTGTLDRVVYEAVCSQFPEHLPFKTCLLFLKASNKINLHDVETEVVLHFEAIVPN